RCFEIIVDGELALYPEYRPEKDLIANNYRSNPRTAILGNLYFNLVTVYRNNGCLYPIEVKGHGVLIGQQAFGLEGHRRAQTTLIRGRRIGAQADAQRLASSGIRIGKCLVLLLATCHDQAKEQCRQSKPSPWSAANYFK